MPPLPVTIASVALPLPTLRISVAQGCIGLSEISLTCTVTRTLAATRPALDLLPPAAGTVERDVAAVEAAAGPALRLVPAVPLVFRPPRAGACIPVDAAITLVPHRTWPMSVAADAASPAGCAGFVALPSISNSSVGVPVPVAAAYAYAHSAAQVHGIRCELRGSPQTAGSPGELIARAQAAALTVEPALPVPRDIFLYRRSLGSLLSLRTGAMEQVLRTDAALFLRDAFLTGDGNSSSEAASDANASIPAVSRFVVSPDAASSNATALALSHALAAAAARLAARDTVAGAAAAAGLSSAPVTGRTELVIMLNTQSMLQRPSLTHSLQAADAYTAAASEVEQLLNSSFGINEDMVSTREAAATACTADGRFAAAAVVGAVPAPRQRLVVSIGGIRARILWIAPDGSQIHVETPTYAELCGLPASSGSSSGSASSTESSGTTASGTGGCGYQAVSLFYEQEYASLPEATIDTGTGSTSDQPTLRRRLQLANSSTPAGINGWVTAWLSEGSSLLTNSDVASQARLSSLLSQVSAEPLARSVSCPPWCPSLVPDGSVPLALPSSSGAASAADWMGALVPAAAAADNGALVPAAGWSSADGSTAALSNGLSSGGLYYTADCAAAGYTSVESGICSNFSNPAHRSCAFTTAAGD